MVYPGQDVLQRERAERLMLSGKGFEALPVAAQQKERPRLPVALDV